MATVTTHTLNGVDGTHAAGIPVSLTRLSDGMIMFSTRTDEGGRLSEDVDLKDADPDATYELVLTTGPYWANQLPSRKAPQILQEVVVRFAMHDLGADYHIPIILSPNSYSVWWSS